MLTKNKNPLFEIVLNPSDYVIKENMSFKFNERSVSFDKCKLAFFNINIGPPKGPMIVFGLNFLRKIYTIFDFQRKVIGFQGEFDNSSEFLKNINDYSDLFRGDEISHLIDNFSNSHPDAWKRVY